MNFAHLDSLKAKLDSFRPLSIEVVENLHEELVLQWTYNSNAIEGNSEPFIKLIGEVVEQSFEPYWWALGVGK